MITFKTDDDELYSGAYEPGEFPTQIGDDELYSGAYEPDEFPTQIGDVVGKGGPTLARLLAGSPAGHQPKATSTPGEAVAEARALCRSGEPRYPRLCLKHVREDWDLPAVEPTAQDAWNNAKHKHAFNGDVKSWERTVPFAAPVFSTNGDATGHVFIAGGFFQRGPAKGRRIFRSNDVRTLGVVNAVTLDFFTGIWGHRILGWTHDLNGFWLPLSTDSEKD